MGDPNASAAEKSVASDELRALQGNGNKLRTAGKLGRTSALKVAGRTLAVVGLAIGEYQNYNADRQRGRSRTSAALEATAQTAADAGIGWGMTEGGAWAGGEVGFLFGGPPGALVGTGLGAAGGAIGAFFVSGEANRLIDKLW